MAFNSSPPYQENLLSSSASLRRLPRPFKVASRRTKNRVQMSLPFRHQDLTQQWLGIVAPVCRVSKGSIREMQMLGANPLGGVSRDEVLCPPVPASCRPSTKIQIPQLRSPPADSVSGWIWESAFFHESSTHWSYEPPIQLYFNYLKTFLGRREGDF